MSADKFEYFITRTDGALAEIRADVKSLLGFRMMLYGGSAVISAIVAYGVVVLFGH